MSIAPDDRLAEIYEKFIKSPFDETHPEYMSEEDATKLFNAFLFENVYGFDFELMNYLEKEGEKHPLNYINFKNTVYPLQTKSYENKNNQDAIKIPTNKDTEYLKVINKLTEILLELPQFDQSEIQQLPGDKLKINDLLIKYSSQSFAQNYNNAFLIFQEQIYPPKMFFTEFSVVSNNLYKTLKKLNFLKTDED